jgi:hypothetical protein
MHGRIRLAIGILLCASVGGMAFSLVTAPWYRVAVAFHELDVPFGRIDTPQVRLGGVVYMLAAFATLLATLWFGVRLGVTMFAALADRPVNYLRWSSPRRAHVDGAVVGALAIVMVSVLPALYYSGSGFAAYDDAMTQLTGLHPGDQLPAELSRAWGCYLFVIAIALGHVVIAWTARLPQLAELHGWPVPDVPVEAAPEPARPLIKPPLTAPRPVDGDPFRAPPQPQLNIIRPETERPVPRAVTADDDSKPTMLT